MIDGEINSSTKEIIATPIDRPTPPTIQELRDNVYRNEVDRENDPDFQIALESARVQMKVVFDAIKARQINLDEAQEILTHMRAEQIMAVGTDPLMDIPNRRAMEERMDRAIAIAQRDGKPLSAAFMDLDDFKKLNDDPNLGHDAGDAALQAWSGHIKSNLRRGGDLVARFGGEELVALMQNTTEENAFIKMDEIRATQSDVITEALQNVGYKITRPVTMSVGIVQMSQEDIDNRTPPQIVRSKMLAEADVRMFISKRAGKNRVTGTAQKVLAA